MACGAGEDQAAHSPERRRIGLIGGFIFIGTITGLRSGGVDGLLVGTCLDAESTGFGPSTGWKGDRPFVKDRFDGLDGMFQGDDAGRGDEDGRCFIGGDVDVAACGARWDTDVLI